MHNPDGSQRSTKPQRDGPKPPSLSRPTAINLNDFRSVSKKNLGAALEPTTLWNLHIRKKTLGFDDLDIDDIEACFLVVE